MTILNKDKILEAAKDFVSEGKFDKAIREYEKLLVADPKDMRVKLRIAELFAKRRQVPEAIKAYREVAQSYAQEGFYLKAVTVYKSILRLNPSLLDVNQALADLYEKMGLNQDAVHQYEILAQAFEQKGQFQEALKVRQKLVELAPKDAAHRIRLAEGYQRDEKKEEAIEQYEILAKQYREQKKEPQRLIELYERILPHRPQNKEMLTDLVHLYYDKKDYKAALKCLEQYKQLVMGDWELLALQAEMYASLNQLETARGKYQELAELYVEKGETQKALSAYGEILAILPEETETLRPLVEGIQSGALEDLIQKANEKRQKKVEDQRIQEEAKEREKEAREREREVAKEAKGGAKGLAPPPPAAAKKPVGDPSEITKWLTKARTALSLAKAYQNTGLENEAKQELTHAQDYLKKILLVDSNHAEAKTLLRELPISLTEKPSSKPKTTAEPSKSKKKISFV